MNNYRVAVLIIFATTLFTANTAEAIGKRKCAEDYRSSVASGDLKPGVCKTACANMETN